MFTFSENIISSPRISATASIFAEQMFISPTAGFESGFLVGSDWGRVTGRRVVVVGRRVGGALVGGGGVGGGWGLDGPET